MPAKVKTKVSTPVTAPKKRKSTKAPAAKNLFDEAMRHILTVGDEDLKKRLLKKSKVK